MLRRGWNQDWKNIEAKPEILAEVLFFDHLLEVSVGSRNETDIQGVMIRS